jgi:chromosome partitioning protein|tara:strand:+ start:474 stop:1115 length:642 start_codon:yes stop_codon:yes gene_type:complete
MVNINMRSILVLNSKGGSGKTTIATNLASFFASIGKSVALVDLDAQQSSISWLKARSSAKPPIIGIKGYGEKVKRGVDYKIIDAPAGLQGAALTKVLNMAESVIIPVLPSPIDMRAAEDFIKNIKKHSRVVKKKSKIALVANRGRDYTNIYWELDDFLERQKIPFLTMIRDSQNFIRGAEKGLGIYEMGPAMTEVDREYFEPIIDWLNSKRSR